MGRLVTHRFMVEGKLVAATPLHIGGATDDLVSDLPLARDGDDRCYIPGTSLAGPIRRWWRRRFDDETMFGHIPERDSDTEGHASYLVIHDAPVSSDLAPSVEVRDSVGIDRDTGAAAVGIKYDREILPGDTRFDFHLEIDITDGSASVPPRADSKKSPPEWPDAGDAKGQLGALILALEGGRIRFGAAKTRGLGRLRLTETKVIEQTLGTRAGILDRLRGGTTARNARDAFVQSAHDTDIADEIEIVVRWRPDLPVMSKSASDGVSVDALPLVTGTGSNVLPIITGASWKGVLRAHAERICRTLAGAAPPDRADTCSPAQEFLDDLAACELVEALFGARGKGKNDDARYKKASRDVPIPGLGALSVDDCVIGPPIARTLWDDLLTVGADDEKLKTGATRALLDRSAWKEFRPATHVAIDRWTGGAAEHLLFSHLETATGGSPRELRLWLDTARLAPRVDDRGRTPVSLADFKSAAVGLLLVVLRELAAGRIPVGHGVTRGLGSIAVEEISFRDAPREALSHGLSAGLKLTSKSFDDEQAMGPFTTVHDAWQNYWSATSSHGHRHGAST